MFGYSATKCDGDKQASRIARLPTGALAAILALGIGAEDAISADNGKNIKLDKANVFFELNHTDEDLGIHLQIDGEAWKKLKIEDPNKKTMLEINVNGRLEKQGLTELFSESAEPPFDELPPSKFFSRFPEGVYRISGTTLEGKTLEGTARLTHVMPAAPDKISISGAAAPTDCESGAPPAVGAPVVIAWQPVTKSHPKVGKPATVEIVKTQVVIAREEPTSMEISVDLPPGVNAFKIPDDLTNPGKGEQYKFEIITREASGNQTAFESCFKIK